jgi:hypothetical protein
MLDRRRRWTIPPIKKTAGREPAEPEGTAMFAVAAAVAVVLILMLSAMRRALLTGGSVADDQNPNDDFHAYQRGTR